MGNLYWLSEAQAERLRPYFPKSHGVLRVDGHYDGSAPLLWRSNSMSTKGRQRLLQSHRHIGRASAPRCTLHRGLLSGQRDLSL